MSQKALVGALVALLLLGTLALILSRTGGTRATTERPLIEFDPATIMAIEVTIPGSPAQRVERSNGADWKYVWPIGEGKSLSWPALPPPQALRAIAQLNGLIGTESVGKLGEARATMRLTTNDGSQVRMSVLNALGGFSELNVDGTGGRSGLARIETSAIDALISPGPGSWRVSLAAPGVRDASRLSITDGSGTIALARLDGKWTMRRPVSARADQGAVGTLLTALAAARIERFEDRPPADPDATGLAKPTMTLAWEIDERAVETTGAVKVQTRHGLLRIGGPADAQGALRFAAADEAGAALMVIPASTLTSIATAPRNYLAPTVTSALPQDVFMLTISDVGPPPEAPGAPGSALRAYRRSMGAWVMQRADSSTTPASGDAVDRLLEFLSQRPGESEPARGDGDLREVARIDLFDLDGDPLDVILAGYNADGTPGFRVKNLITLFPGVDPPELLNMPPFASLAPLPDAPAPLSAPEGAPVGK